MQSLLHQRQSHASLRLQSQHGRLLATPVKCMSADNSTSHRDAPLDQASSSSATPITRRVVGAALAALLPSLAIAEPSQAGFKKELKKRKISEDEYTLLDAAGLRVYDLEQGGGSDAIKEGDKVVVHFDCLFRGIDAVSSRSARLLGGNRTIAEPYEFVVGEPVYGTPIKAITDSANGLFAGSGGPKPPQALSLAVLGMKKGGKRSVIVDNPDVGYPKGMLEIPAGATFELKVEVLNVFPAQQK